MVGWVNATSWIPAFTNWNSGVAIIGNAISALFVDHVGHWKLLMIGITGSVVFLVMRTAESSMKGTTKTVVRGFPTSPRREILRHLPLPCWLLQDCTVWDILQILVEYCKAWNPGSPCLVLATSPSSARLSYLSLPCQQYKTGQSETFFRHF